MRFLLLVFLITSCGTDNRSDPPPLAPVPTPTPERKLDTKEFAKLVREFEADSIIYARYPIRVNSLIVRFNRIENDDPTKVILGRCYLRSGRTPLIDIDYRYWDRRTWTEKKTLMYHEMGHCVLKRSHALGDSLMNAWMLSGYRFDADPDYYLTELFDNSKRNSIYNLYAATDEPEQCLH